MARLPAVNETGWGPTLQDYLRAEHNADGTQHTYATVAALTAETALTDTRVVYLRGYASDGDGGQGTFRYSASSVATVDNGTVLAAAGGVGRWLRQFSGALNVRWFGAKGDGATDDTAAVQNTVNAISTNGGTVFFPRGIYKITTAITPKGHTLYKGEARQGSVVLASACSGIVFPGVGHDDANNFMAFEDLTIRGDSSAGNVGLSLKYSHYATVNRCIIERFGGGGIVLELSFSGQINAAHVRDNDGPGIKLNQGANAWQILGGGEIQRNNGWGILAQGSSSYTLLRCTIDGVTIEGNRDGGISFVDNVRQVTIHGCYFEKNYLINNTYYPSIAAPARVVGSYPTVGRDIYLGSGANAVLGVEIAGNLFSDCMDGVNVTTGYNVDLNQVAGCRIDGNVFTTAGGATKRVNWSVTNTNTLYGLETNYYADVGPVTSGIVPFNGTTGTTVTHNFGESNYVVVVTPRLPMAGVPQVAYNPNFFKISSSSAADTMNASYLVVRYA